MATSASVLTAEEFAATPDTDSHTELVRGRIIESPLPDFLHGLICTRVIMLICGSGVDRGGAATSRVGVIPTRDPDTVRGPDMTYFQPGRIPKGDERDSYLEVPPNLIVEVRSAFDLWSDLEAKVPEYLDFGVAVVLLLDPTTRSAFLYRLD